MVLGFGAIRNALLAFLGLGVLAGIGKELLPVDDVLFQPIDQSLRARKIFRPADGRPRVFGLLLACRLRAVCGFGLRCVSDGSHERVGEQDEHVRSEAAAEPKFKLRSI